MEEAGKRNVVVTRTAGLNSIAVADFVLGLVVALSRNIVLTHGELVYNNKWFRKPGKMLHELTVGIVGLGNIGRTLVKKLRALSVGEFLAFNRSWSEEIKQFSKKYSVSLINPQAVMYSSDVVCVCLALDKNENGGTQNFISRDLLQLMKPDAFLVNVGRGSTIDEEALYEMLEQDKIAGAALDVYSKEPPMDWDLFQKFQALARRGKNIILTPHMGSIAKSSEEMIAMHAAQNVVNVLSGDLENAEVVKN
jgi:phosphoglycerate dehydrogenase-like enzyme